MQLGRRRDRLTSPNDSRYNRRNKARSLTASGMRVGRREGVQMRQILQPWQQRAFAYYDILGEINFAAQFYARMLAPLRLFAAELVDGEIVETDNAEAVAALDRIQDPGGGRTGLLSSYGRLMFIAGECQLFVSQDDNDVEQWEMLSTDELRVQDDRYLRVKAPSLGAEEYTGPSSDADWVPVTSQGAVAYRLWQRHPRYSMLADSTMKGVLDLCEELVLLTKAVRARSKSRLAGAGILLIADSISKAPPEPTPDEDPQEDPFMAQLIEAMTAPMADEGVASAVVPLVLRVPSQDQQRVADLIHHLQIVDPTQLYPETGLRYECLKRIAVSLDMPPEILLGLGDVNHWGSWQIDEQTWKGHGQPKAQQLVDDLTSSYFRPYLADPKRLGKDAKRFLIAYDAAAVVNHPDKGRDAKDLHGEGELSGKALREATGFSDEDAPDEQERARWVGVKTGDARLAMTGEVSDTDGGQPPTPTPPERGAEAPADVEPGPPETRNGKPAEAAVQAIVARVLGASDLGVLRAREAAGSRLRSLAKRDPDAEHVVQGIPNGAVAATLGRDRVRALKAPAVNDLVAGATPLIVDAFRVWDIPEQVAAVVADQVSRHAAATLYEPRPRPMPDSFEGYVTGLLTTG